MLMLQLSVLFIFSYLHFDKYEVSVVGVIVVLRFTISLSLLLFFSFCDFSSCIALHSLTNDVISFVVHSHASLYLSWTVLLFFFLSRENTKKTKKRRNITLSFVNFSSQIDLFYGDYSVWHFFTSFFLLYSWFSFVVFVVILCVVYSFFDTYFCFSYGTWRSVFIRVVYFFFIIIFLCVLFSREKKSGRLAKRGIIIVNHCWCYFFLFLIIVFLFSKKKKTKNVSFVLWIKTALFNINAQSGCKFED